MYKSKALELTKEFSCTYNLTIQWGHAKNNVCVTKLLQEMSYFQDMILVSFNTNALKCTTAKTF